MIGYPLLVALAVLALVWLVSACALLLTGRARLAGTLLAADAVVMFVVVALGARGESLRVIEVVLLLAGFMALLVLTAYPRVDWRSTLDVVTFTVVAAAPVALLSRYASGVPEGDPLTIAEIAATAGALVVMGHTWWRLERSSGAERWALSWMALSAGLALFLGALISFAAPTTAGGIVASLALAAVAPALYIGVARPEVVDVRGLVVRVIVLVTSLVGYVAVFMSGAAVLELLGDEAPSVGSLAIWGALAAITFHPLRVLLLGVVDELLFGTRPDPLGAASHVATSIGDDPVLALRAIREALVLPYAALSVDGRPLASSGTEVTHTRAFALPLGGGQAGELVVGLRAGDLRLSESDEHVLRLATPLLAQALRARALARDLQDSREQTISAVAEERRRLRRDLHDGLGPRLSGIAFTSDAARNTLRADPEHADGLLRSLRIETVTAIDEIRRLVYDMRPPALDELGLVAAIRQQAAQLATTDGRPLRLQLAASELPPLPAAVEVAAYRIVVEALTNAARHSGADLAEASLRVVGGALEIEVCDHGTATGTWTGGVGLSSMRERAAELGGTLVTRASEQGGQVIATLPLAQVSPPAPHAPTARS